MAYRSQPTCVVVSGGDSYHGKQDLDYLTGISARTAGSRAISMLLTTIPPGARAQAHLHRGHETAIYILSGASEVWFGEELEQRLVARAGDFLYIPAGMPHQPVNMSESEPCVAILARTDPNEQESVVFWPEGSAEMVRRPSSLITPNGN